MLLIYPLVFGMWEIVLIVLVVLLLFGGKKIPELMKGLGKGVRSFKEGISEVDEQVSDIKKELEKPAETKSEEVKKQD